LIVGGCGGGSSSDGSTASTGSGTGEAAVVAQHLTKVEGPPLKVGARQGPPPRKLGVIDLRKGDGVAAKPGDELTVQFVAVYDTTGVPLESSWEDGATFTFKLDSESVNQGWVQGLPGMRVGGKRELLVPTKLSFNHPVPPGASPDESLIYVIELLEARPPGARTPATTRERAEPKLEVPKGPPPERLIVKDVEKGTGPPAKDGDELTVHYVGMHYTTGKPFSPGSWGFGGPYTFTLGAERVSLGWERGLKGMRVGGRRKLFIPSRLALPGGEAHGVSPKGSLAYVIDLLEVKSP
jgi:peptidylprolyl isomerase